VAVIACAPRVEDLWPRGEERLQRNCHRGVRIAVADERRLLARINVAVLVMLINTMRVVEQMDRAPAPVVQDSQRDHVLDRMSARPLIERANTVVEIPEALAVHDRHAQDAGPAAAGFRACSAPMRRQDGKKAADLRDSCTMHRTSSRPRMPHAQPIPSARR
jgi:hypothetical protein